MSKKFVFYLKYFTPTNVCDHLSAQLVFMSVLVKGLASPPVAAA